MEKRKKVLFFLSSTTGGAERMTVNIAKMLPTDKFEVKFVVVNRSLMPIVNFIPLRYPIIHISIYNIYCFTTLRMMWVIAQEKPDVVFCSMNYLNIRLIRAARALKTKVVIRLNIELSKSNPKRLRTIKRLYPLASRIISQQQEMTEDALSLLNISPDKIVTLQNPLDTEYIDKCVTVEDPYPNNVSGYKYVCVGRFSHEKGQDLLIKAFAEVHRVNPAVHLYFVGNFNPQRQYDKGVLDFVEQHNLKECVHFIGFDVNPYRWVKYSDCYIMPSRLEGLPNSLVEAMYIGKPVVASNCIPIIERIIENGYNGYVVANENVVEMSIAMTKAILLTDFHMTYKSATTSDFVRLFNTI